jgi:chemotaxis protein CheY-P-specific phosphatase CheC
MEVGNILASHVASGIADALGSRLLPSIPSLAMEGAEEAFCELIESVLGETAHRDAPRIESALLDAAGALRGRLVLVPTRLDDESTG